MKHHRNYEGRSNNNVGFIAGALLGGLIGAGIALLVTPNDGKKNRKIVKKKGSELLSKAESQFDEFKKEKIDPMMEEAQQDLEKKFDSAKKEIQNKVKEVEKKVKKEVKKKTKK